ncbi:MAG: choice-of-anchor D domain-containing protein [Chloroflexaceae bacterium]|nr:choice-of-anchor D domain-containing protein [Chloroflexaceae bacterium]
MGVERLRRRQHRRWRLRPPTDGTYDGTETDISDFRFAYDTDNIYILAYFPTNADVFGAIGPRVQVYLDRGSIATGRNTQDTGAIRNDGQFFDLAFDASFNYDFAFSNRRGYDSLFLYNVAADANSYPPAGGVENERINGSTDGFVEMSIPWSQIGGYPTGTETIQLAVVVGHCDQGKVTEVSDNPTQYHNGGGGCTVGSQPGPLPPPATDGDQYFVFDGDSDVFDMIGLSAAAQLTALTSPDCANDVITTLPAAAQISIQLNPPPAALTISQGGVYYDNTYIRLLYNLPVDTSTTVVDAANYTVTGIGATTFSVVETGRGDIDGNTNIWLRLNNPVADADLVTPGVFTATARVVYWDGQNSNALAALMIRNSATDSSRYVGILSRYNNLNDHRLRLYSRGTDRYVTTTSGDSNPTQTRAVPFWLRLVRNGNTVQAFYASDLNGAPQSWISLGSRTVDVPFSSVVQMGLGVTIDLNPQNDTRRARAAFDNITIEGLKPVIPPTPAPELTFDPIAIDFGSQVTGQTSAQRTIVMRNVGTADATGIVINLQGTNPGDFARTTTCGATLAVGAACNINVTFTPSVAGDRSAFIDVDTANAGTNCVLA